ncbi:hypothetical protein [Pseudonocardia spirodelae]|uniref:Transcriptional repressor PaaX-like central Cas2-like domain-containing protein n=1 Tax=Pseudonocardia spirodelae TaxID=3133431 RepID=A0ABU8T3M5_9PSEU
MSRSVELDRLVARRDPASGAVASLFRTAGRDELPAVVLVALLGDLGTREAAARRLLSRMRDDGRLAARRDGRAVHLRLHGAFGASVQRVGDGLGARPPEWTGAFEVLLHAVPESERAYRDRLRRTAVLAGYGVLQPGVLIAATDRSADLAGVLDDVPPGARVTRGSLAVDTAEAGRIAAEAWDLDRVAAVLAGHADRLAAMAEGDGAPPPAADAATLRRLVESTTPVFVDLLRAPALPAPLLPAHWPVARLAGGLSRVLARYVPPARAHVSARLAGHGTGVSPPGLR